jgi:hypothetical protein
VPRIQFRGNVGLNILDVLIAARLHIVHVKMQAVLSSREPRSPCVALCPDCPDCAQGAWAPFRQKRQRNPISRQPRNYHGRLKTDIKGERS